MSTKTGILWTDHTFNPWWGCVKVSDGCTNCYALDHARRFGHDIWGPAATTRRRTFGSKHWQEPLKWDALAEEDGRRHRVFCASMSDVFEQHPMLEDERLKLWSLIALTPSLDWQLLTKRPENVLAMVPPSWLANWPSHVWMGTSVEHQLAADLRIPRLLEIPARVRFLSAEPLLGPLDLGRFLTTGDWCPDPQCGDSTWDHYCQLGRTRHEIHWLIVGGESGGPAERRLVEPNTDPSYPYRYKPTQQAARWIHSLKMQARDARVAFFFKQWGGPHHSSGGREIDGLIWSEFPRDSLPLPRPAEVLTDGA